LLLVGPRTTVGPSDPTLLDANPVAAVLLVTGTTSAYFLFEWRLTASTAGSAFIGPGFDVRYEANLPLTGSEVQNLSGSTVTALDPGEPAFLENYGPDTVFVPAGAHVVFTGTRLGDYF